MIQDLGLMRYNDTIILNSLRSMIFSVGQSTHQLEMSKTRINFHLPLELLHETQWRLGIASQAQRVNTFYICTLFLHDFIFVYRVR